MSDRQRVRRAIDAPVEAASKLREEMPESDLEARVLAIVDGWGRGLAAGLEELAVAVGELRRLELEDAEDAEGSEQAAPFERADEPSDRTDDAEADRGTRAPGPASVEDLQARAVASREETRSLRERDSD